MRSRAGPHHNRIIVGVRVAGKSFICSVRLFTRRRIGIDRPRIPKRATGKGAFQINDDEVSSRGDDLARAYRSRESQINDEKVLVAPYAIAAIG